MRIKKTQTGFGLIELMVSIGVMVLVTSIVLVRQSTFNSAVLLENQAYEIAFDIRETQLRAVSAQGGVDADFRTQYGVTFLVGEQQYSFFRGEPDGSEVLFGASARLDRRFYIADVRRPDGTSFGNGAHVTFIRPEYDALIWWTGGGGGVALESGEDWVDIYVCSLKDDTNMSARVAAGDMRYDMNNDGVVNGTDLNIIRDFSSGECNFRRIRVSNTGQITVN